MTRKPSNTKPQPSQILNASKFTLYNFAGKEKAHYLVERKPLQQNPENFGKIPIAHSIVIIDRSGSMYGDIETLKDYLIKLLTLDEYRNSELLITLISYSSQRDVICHFQRIPITQLMAANSSYLKTIKQIKVTGCTCISQSLEIAKTLMKEFVAPGEVGEVTAITLHTDGYANDPSYNSEVKALEAICEQLKTLNVFVNTISYSSADYKLLAKIANSLSGKCLQAGKTQEVYDALYQTTTLLNESLTPPIEESLSREYDYQVFVSQTAKKINGAAGTVRILGLKPEDEGVFYKYKKLTQSEYAQFTDIPVIQNDESVFAFIKAHLAEGNLNTAKYALVSTFDETLVAKHVKALTNQEIADFTQEVEEVIFEPSRLLTHRILSAVPVTDKITVLELLDCLQNHQDGIIINLKHLEANYQRKGLKRLRGSRDEQGNLIKPWLKTEPIDGGQYVQMGTFEINRNTATINMLIKRPVKLVKEEDNTTIVEVAGILLNDLKQYNYYTIVSDGEINLKQLKVKINDQKVFESLKAKGVLEKAGQVVKEEMTFDFRSEYEIRLDNLPLVKLDQQHEALGNTFIELVALKILTSILSAHLKEESTFFSAEQIEELKKHYLSKNLYLNFPTTTEYTNLQDALNEGTVDTRVSYKIDLGDREILNLSKLYSANQFLDRFYEVYDQDTGEKIEKPTFELTLDHNLVFGHKTLSARTKVTKVDEIMRGIFDDFLGLTANNVLAPILDKVEAHSLLKLLQAKHRGENINRQELITALSESKFKLEKYTEHLYRQKLSPLVFYIGATGLIPDEWQTKAMTAEEVSAQYPELKIAKAEKDGTFFVVGDNLITVYAVNEYFSTKKPAIFRS